MPTHPLKGADTQKLSHALGPFGRRYRSARALRWGCYGLVPALIGVLILQPSHAAWSCLAVPALTAIIAALWPLSLGQVARSADRSAQLNGAADTALHLADIGHPAAAAVAADAVDALEGKLPPKLVAPPYYRPLSAVVLVLLLLIGLRVAWEAREPELDLAQEQLPDPLDEIEERARRAGDTELVEAVQELRVRMEQARPPVAVRRHAPPPKTPAPIPTAAPLPLPPPQLPADMESPEQYQEAVELAMDTMASDDALLAAIAEEIYEQLQDISFGGDLGVNFLEETMMDGDLSAMSAADYQAQEGGQVQNTDPMAAFSTFGADQETLNNQIMETTGIPKVEFDPSLVKGDDLDSESHETKANLMASYRDFMKEYSEAMRDELIRAIEESADPDKWKDEQQPEEGEESKPGGPKVAGDPSDDSQGSTRSQAQLRPTDSEPPEGAQAMSAPVGAQGKPSGRGEGSSGGDAGAGKRLGGGGGASGELSLVQGQLTPGALDDAQRQAVLEGVAQRSVEAGPGQEFDEAWGGYFDEMDRTLEEEDMPPQMQSMVRAYFAGLQEQ